MSILTEINRIKDAVTAIVNAIKNKGVTVPTTAKVDDLPTYIDAIQQGEDVTTETNEYTSLNAELEEVINSLPDAGGGSESVEICTVTVNGGASLLMIGTVINESGEIEGVRYSLSSSGLSIWNSNFVKGTHIVFLDDSWGIIPYGVTAEGADSNGTNMQDGVAVFILTSDTATFTFAS